MGRAKNIIAEKKLSSWKLLDDFLQRLARIRAKMPQPPEIARQNPGGPERLLLDDDYFSLMLFGLFKPILYSMRGLCAASHLKRVQEDACAAKLHLKFSVLRQAPCDAIVTDGNSCERKALRGFAKKGEIIVGDRYYGLEYGFLNELRGAKWSGELIRFYLMGHAGLDEVVVGLLGLEKTAV